MRGRQVGMLEHANLTHMSDFGERVPKRHIFQGAMTYLLGLAAIVDTRDSVLISRGNRRWALIVIKKKLSVYDTVSDLL